MVKIPKKLQPGQEQNRLGRPIKGALRNCLKCGEPIYVKPYRLRKGLGQYCVHCVREQQSLSIRTAIQGLAIYSGKFTAEEMGDRACKILIKYLDKNPEGTVKELVGKNEFTEEDLIKATFEILITEVLRQSDEFECVDERLNIWQIKVPMELEPKLEAKEKPTRVSIPQPVEGIHPIYDDYPEPWCRVTKDGKIIRYEDTGGRSIPEALWPK